ncbi:G-protein coupled receptor Mth2-like [Cloeon dipterum]|uniref:G-protein coupled receptor Mth2-like n=1 Tax=Cloeon dipterum TaxID=197152 RepID=UPI0032203782
MKLILQLLVAISISSSVGATGGLNFTKAPPIKLDGAVKFNEKNETVTHNGVSYARGEFFKDGVDYYAIPCNTNACIRQCSKAFAARQNVTLLTDDRSALINVSHEEKLYSVRLHDHFHVLNETECENEHEFETEGMIHLANGSLSVMDLDENDNIMSIIFHKHEYCVLADEEGNIKTWICDVETEVEIEMTETSNSTKYMVYPVFMIISIVCLLLTLLAFVFTPDMRNLHGKSIACQSFTLMMAYIGLTVVQTCGSIMHGTTTCKIFAYMSYGFILSFFFWLNTMCFDIFWTFSDFKKLLQTSKKKFRMYAVYSTLSPLLIVLTTFTLDSALDTNSSYWPGIGQHSCWFKDRKSEFVYLHVHLLLLLIANTIFFILAFVKITRMNRERRCLKRGDSKIHGGAGSSAYSDRQRFALNAKLFILMGGTWVMELISWAMGGKPMWFWMPFDIINSSRGAIIFILCVVLNRKVRTPLLARFLPSFQPDRCANGSRYCTSKVSEVSHSHDAGVTTQQNEKIESVL